MVIKAVAKMGFLMLAFLITHHRCWHRNPGKKEVCPLLLLRVLCGRSEGRGHRDRITGAMPLRKRSFTSELLTQQQGEILKVGFLRKKGHVRRNWLDRWFVLTTEGIYYYKNRQVGLAGGFCLSNMCGH